MDLGQQARTKQIRELPRVSTIGLHPIARHRGDFRRRDDRGLDAELLELSHQPEAERSGFVAGAQLARALLAEAPHEAPERLLGVGELDDLGVLAPRIEDRSNDCFLVGIEPDESGRGGHDRLLTHAALAYGLTRDQSCGWLFTPQCVPVGRSLHMV
jgi:hypothetical protein